MGYPFVYREELWGMKGKCEHGDIAIFLII